ncbi:hypothetical protein D7Y06_20215 [Roseburia sp. 1XD42-69]|nr:hypothetical protein D7Y06_20215 [Roseburia sp. 1XD42-69]
MTSRKEPKRERPGMTWALRSLYRPSARAHLPTTCQGAMVVLPDGSRAPSGGGSAGVSSPADIYQQTLTAACASGGAAPMHWGGLGAVGHQQAAPGIYRGIACYYCQRLLGLFHEEI